MKFFVEDSDAVQKWTVCEIDRVFEMFNIFLKQDARHIRRKPLLNRKRDNSYQATAHLNENSLES